MAHERVFDCRFSTGKAIENFCEGTVKAGVPQIYRKDCVGVILQLWCGLTPFRCQVFGSIQNIKGWSIFFLSEAKEPLVVLNRGLAVVHAFGLVWLDCPVDYRGVQYPYYSKPPISPQSAVVMYPAQTLVPDLL